MKNKELWNSLHEIFWEVMDNPSIKLEEKTSAKDIAEWDSISHVMLIVEVEKKFGIRFTASEIQSLQSVGELLALTDAKSTKESLHEAA